MAEMPDEMKGQKFFAFMCWVALLGAALILAIDYQIKAQILRESKKAWEGIHAVKGETRGASSTANPAGGLTASDGARHGPQMEMGTVAGETYPDSPEGTPPISRAKTQPRARDGRGRFSADSEPVDS